VRKKSLHVGGCREQFGLARTTRETIPTAIGVVEEKLGNCGGLRGVSWAGRDGPLPIPCLNLELQLA